jgi:hypothetical protein
MKRLIKFLIYFLPLIYSFNVFAQSANPRPARSTWYKELDYFKNGSMTFTYKTLDAPVLTGVTYIGDDLDMSVSGSGVYDITLRDGVADALSFVRGTTDVIVFDTSTPKVTITPAVDITGLLTTAAGIDLGTSQALVGTTGLTIGNGGQTVAVNSSDWDINATGDMTGIGAITADGKLTLESTLTGGANVQDSYKLTLTAGETYTGTTGHVFKVYDADNTVVHDGGEHCGVYVNMKQLSAMASGGKSVLFSGHNYGSGGDYQIIDAGVWLYGNLVDAFKISGGSIETGLDLSETTVSGQDIEFSGGGTLVSAANSVTFDDIVTGEDFYKTGNNGSTLGSGTNVTITNTVAGVNQTVITFAAYAMTITDHGADGAQGSFKMIDFPEGMIEILGAVGDLSVVCGTTGLSATATYDAAIGTETCGIDNSTLAGAEQDIVNLVQGDLSTSAADWDLVTVVSANFDGHTAADDAWLNVAFEQDDCSTNDVATITGTVTITWVNLGDY